MPSVNKLLTITLPEAEFEEHLDASDGICLVCGAWTSGGCEPDAANYRCEVCCEHEVYGAALALIMMAIEFGEEPT